MEKATQAKTILTTMPVFISGICLIRCLLRKKETERERETPIVFNGRHFVRWTLKTAVFQRRGRVGVYS